MAKPKNESTAVNELINLVSTQGPGVKEDEDLMFSPPTKKKKKSARMSATVPPMRGSGAVEPLPRSRAPQGTREHAQINPVRMMTAPAARPSSIPPLPQPTAPVAKLDSSDETPIRERVTRPSLPPPTRTSASSLPPPVPRSTASAPALPPPVRTNAAPSSPPPVPTTSSVPSLPPPVRTTAIVPALSPPVRVSVPELPSLRPHANPMIARPIEQAPSSVDTTKPWSEQSLTDLRTTHAPSESWAGTTQVPRRATFMELARKLVLPMVGLVIVGVFVGGYLAIDGQDGQGGAKRHPGAAVVQAPVAKAKANEGQPAAAPSAEVPTAVEPAAMIDPVAAAPAADEPVAGAPAAVEPGAVAAAAVEPGAVAPAAVAAVEPAKVDNQVPAPVTPPNLAATTPAPKAVTPPNLAVAPAVAPSVTPPAPTGRVVFVDVRIDSKPTGATVTLVDRGKTTFLGTTPVTAALDPSRTYDLVFSHKRRVDQTERLDPKTTKRLAVELTRRSKNDAKVVSSIAAPAIEAPKAVKAKAAPAIEAPKVEAPKVAPAKTDKALKNDTVVEEPTGRTREGTLMISSKPPCEIYIDGKATGLMTPQRAISLPAGAHKVTLVNKAEKINKTLGVKIVADKPTKVIEDLLAK